MWCVDVTSLTLTVMPIFYCVVVVFRERGIEIELPSDRKSAASKGEATRPVKFVKIPCDESLPVTELTLPVEEDRTGDQLTSILRIYFTQGSVKIDDVKDAAAKQFTNQEVNISQKTIDKLSDVGSVEVFPLAQPNEYNQNCKVSFYLDEVGQLKKLARNRRASQFAELCGFRDVPLVGDIFIGRVGPAPETAKVRGPVNHDFTLAEFSSDAAWLKDVVRHNYEAGVAANKVAMESDIADESGVEAEVAGTEGVKWSETAEFVELSVVLPAEITKFTAKDINVKIQSAQVSIKVKNGTAAAISRGTNTAGPGEFLTLWEGALAGKVSVDDSTWCINDRRVELTLEKAGNSGGLWKKLTV